MLQTIFHIRSCSTIIGQQLQIIYVLSLTTWMNIIAKMIQKPWMRLMTQAALFTLEQNKRKWQWLKLKKIQTLHSSTFKSSSLNLSTISLLPIIFPIHKTKLSTSEKLIWYLVLSIHLHIAHLLKIVNWISISQNQVWVKSNLVFTGGLPSLHTQLWKRSTAKTWLCYCAHTKCSNICLSGFCILLPSWRSTTFICTYPCLQCPNWHASEERQGSGPH